MCQTFLECWDRACFKGAHIVGVIHQKNTKNYQTKRKFGQTERKFCCQTEHTWGLFQYWWWVVVVAVVGLWVRWYIEPLAGLISDLLQQKEFLNSAQAKPSQLTMFSLFPTVQPCSYTRLFSCTSFLPDLTECEDHIAVDLDVVCTCFKTWFNLTKLDKTWWQNLMTKLQKFKEHNMSVFVPFAFFVGSITVS